MEDIQDGGLRICVNDALNRDAMGFCHFWGWFRLIWKNRVNGTPAEFCV
jgi:hypothetical protein